MRNLITTALLALSVHAGAVCTLLPANGMNILLPNFNDSGDVWAGCLRYDFQVLGSSAVDSTGSAFTGPLYMGAAGSVDRSTWSRAGFSEYYGVAAATVSATVGVTVGGTDPNNAAYTQISSALVEPGTDGSVEVAGKGSFKWLQDSTPTNAWALSPAPSPGNAFTGDMYLTHYHSGTWGQLIHFATDGSATFNGGVTASTGGFTTSVTVPGGFVAVTSGTRVVALGVGTDIPGSGIASVGPITVSGGGVITSTTIAASSLSIGGGGSAGAGRKATIDASDTNGYGMIINHSGAGAVGLYINANGGSGALAFDAAGGDSQFQRTFVNGSFTASSMTATGAGVAFNVSAGSATVAGQANIGWEQITTSCGAGVTTCTASCSANKVILGGGCDAGAIAIVGDKPSSTTSWLCNSLSAATVVAYAMCARMGP